MRSLKNISVFVGLSGGVDSAVSALLLKEAGAQVTGVFVKGWYPPDLPCTWAEDRRDAMRVAAKLHIPFVTLDASTEYKRGVIDYLVDEYKAGRTPNPDVMCNRDVKFGALYTFAKAHGAHLLATGHYAKTDGNGIPMHGLDTEKDQSYFLWAVPKKTMENVRFPIGNLAKGRVRELAKQAQLPVAAKKDSQGICFLGSISVEEFLEAEFGKEPGVVVDESGKEIGRHSGVLLHTLGERLSLQNGPWYVRAKDIEGNRLVAGRDKVPASSTSKSVAFQNENWFSDPARVTRMQYRYHGPVITGSIENGQFMAHESLPEILAPGQSIVFYNGDEMIGGGIICP